MKQWILWVKYFAVIPFVKNNVIKYMILFFAMSIPCLYSEVIDLEETFSHCVLETKQIVLKQFPGAFNPSLIRWQGKYLLSFRVIPNSKYSFFSWIGLVWLNDQFEPIGQPQKVQMRLRSPAPCRAEDARLVIVRDKLYMVYSDNPEIKLTGGGFRMHIAEIVCKGDQFDILQEERISSFEGINPKRREKNWVPFAYDNELLLAYSLSPHRILSPIFGSGACRTLFETQGAFDWSWGELRGGTPGILENGQYIAFFHSTKRLASIQSQGKEISHYFMGAYTFSAQPPFAIEKISPKPIIGRNFYTGKMYPHYWKPVRAIFPCGLVSDGPYFWVAYGREDHELWVAKIDKSKLFDSLVTYSAVD